MNPECRLSRPVQEDGGRHGWKSMNGRKRTVELPLRVAGMYALLAGAWILLSDQLITRLTADPRQLTFLQTYKGWGFVMVTATVLYLFVRREWSMLQREMQARRQAEEDLREINAELEQRVARRTTELARAKRKAEDADRLKSAFLATMSHELRTPLNSIIGFTGILRQGLAGLLNSEQRKQLGMVQISARHLLSLINDILDISKIEAGQLVLTCSTFELPASIRKTVELISPLAEQKGLELQVDIAGNVAAVTTDQRRLEQVVLNLLNNGVKFTDRGHVRISCREDNGSYQLTVADTGIGIRPEEIDGLFQPFHQIDAGLSRRREGTGLGLSICMKLIVMMGGTIDVHSRWGQGSIFTVRFPKHAGDLS